MTTETQTEAIELPPNRRWLYEPELTYTETGRVKVSDMLDHRGVFKLLGLGFEAQRTAALTSALRVFLDRFVGRHWTIDVRCDSGSIIVTRSHGKVPEVMSTFRLPHDMKVVKVDATLDTLILICERFDADDRTMQVFIHRKDIDSIVLRPKAVIHRREIVDIGTITVTPYDRQGNAFFVDFDLADTRLFNGIADYERHYQFKDRWKNIHIKTFKPLNSSVFSNHSYVFTDPMGLAMAVMDSDFESTEPLFYGKVTAGPVPSDDYGYLIRLSSSTPECVPIRSVFDMLEDFKDSQQPAEEV